MPYRKRPWLLSRGELAFYRVLVQAVAGRWVIMCKVRLADLITCSERAWRTGHGGRISQKHLDFVLCDGATTRVVLAVELDDRSHEASDRKRRDAFLDRVLRVTGVRLIRFRARANYAANEIGVALRDAAGGE
jgi:very-short-patch-repair endonuclease